jgi:hypothetical protein
MSEDPLTRINDIFVEHNIACDISFDVSTRGVPFSQRKMICNQFQHTFPEYQVTLHSDRFHFVASDRAAT